ncbi:hypothetical protein F2P81_019574 [Scophthalmus maximus]|uniref:Uncharacterized protein n=1 Tax=Scophthalmus maximus TaxID=52904 RepID=A0A6A4S601_SCOMX|nr:hypothetical protein F2P81_019574 [Scophthalmus maximus]
MPCLTFPIASSVIEHERTSSVSIRPAGAENSTPCQRVPTGPPPPRTAPTPSKKMSRTERKGRPVGSVVKETHSARSPATVGSSAERQLLRKDAAFRYVQPPEYNPLHRRRSGELQRR